MSYATIEEQLRSLPEEYLDEISSYIEFIVFKHQLKEEKKQDQSEYFGSVTTLSDGMDVQRSLRDEWD